MPKHSKRQRYSTKQRYGALNEDYDRFEEAEQEEISKVTSELESAETHFNEEVAKLDAFMKGRTKDTALEEGKPHIAPEDIDAAVIQNHLVSDSRFQGTGEDAAGFAQSMNELVNTIVARKLKEATEAATTASASSSEDVTMTHFVDKAGKSRPIRPGVQLALKNDTTPTPAQKKGRRGTRRSSPTGDHQIGRRGDRRERCMNSFCTINQYFTKQILNIF